MSTKGIMRGIRISGLAAAVPDHLLHNEDFFDRWGEEYVRKVIDVTGINNRYAALPRQTASDFAFEALNVLREKGVWAENNVDALIFVTQSPDYASPATAAVLHHRLGIHSECLAYDVTLGCSGFVSGLFMAGGLLGQGFRRVLVCGGDCSTLHGDPNDATTALLFGDGCFGVVVEAAENTLPWHYCFRTMGDGYRAIMTPAWLPFGRRRHLLTPETDCSVGNLQMAGMDVFTFTVSDVPAAIKEVLAEVPAESIDYLMLHQANLYIMKQVARAVKFKMDKVPVSIGKFGNTSGATIPLGLCDLFGESAETAEKHLLLAGFGVGLSLGVMDVYLSPSVCEPVVRTRRYYDDANDKEQYVE